jgi:hypothetical protein
MKKIYICEKAYDSIVEDKQSVSSARAKVEGIIHHIKPFIEMSDEQLTQIETIAKNIGHFAEYEWEYFGDKSEPIYEKKEKRDRCLKIADRKYDKPSAYKSGAVVRCRNGDIWKDEKA